MSDHPDWDSQFAETEEERNSRLRQKRLGRLVYDKTKRTIVDPRDPRQGMFVLHNCWRCKDGREPCVNGENAAVLGQCKTMRAWLHTR